MRPKIRVLFVSHSGHWGGAQKCLFLLLEALDRSRFDPLVVVPQEGDFAAKARSLGISTRILPLEWLAVPAGLRAELAPKYREELAARTLGLCELLLQQKVDVVFTNTAVVAEGALAATLCGLPHVWYVLELLSQDPDLEPLIALPLLYAFMDRFSNRLVAMSQAVERELSQFLPSSKLTVIRPGLAAGTPPAAVRGSGPLIGFVGAFSKRKGVLNLVDAAPAVLARQPRARFILLGMDCGTLADVRDRIMALGLESAFEILPFRPDPSEVFATMDLLVVPSTAEPFGLVILEAMAAAKPVVATRSGGPQEIIEDGCTGLLVQPNDPRELARAISQLLDDPETMKRMGTLGARQLTERFRQDAYARAFESIFEETASRARRRESFSGASLRALDEFAQAIETAPSAATASEGPNQEVTSAREGG